MRALVIIEYDLDAEADRSPFDEALQALRERLPDTAHAKPVRIHLAIEEAVDRALAALAPPPTTGG